MWVVTIFCLGSYLLGAVPFGLLLSKLLLHQDPRTLGSRNIGATNVFRSVSRALGVLTLIGDVAKGWLPVWAAMQTSIPSWAVAAVGLSCLLGHLYPIYLHFQGGKGVATGGGIFLALAPHAALGSLIFFSFGLMLSGYVSVGSLLAAVSLPCLVLLLKGIHPYLGLAIICSALVLFRHRDNIRRLKDGAERSWRR